MKIFLIGFMGCGKTKWGEKFASHLGCRFMDLDHILEAQVGMTIAEYFSGFGEEAFRKLESSILKETDYPEDVIVSTGGGLPCFFDNLDWMNATGQTLYIKLNPATLADRLEKGKAKRPVLQGKHGEDLVNFIAEKLAEREAFYSRATHTIDGINLSVERLADAVK